MKDLVNDGFRNVVKPYIDREDKKSREIIAPVEVSPAEAAHSIGDQIVYNGILYDVTAAIAIGDALATSGAGENISEADDITTQIKNHTVTTDATPTQGSTNPVQSGGVYASEQKIFAVMGANGAKNLFNPDANTQTYKDVTYTKNTDKTYSTTGTANANGGIFFGEFLAKANVLYTLSGCPSGGSDSSYCFVVRTVKSETGAVLSYQGHNVLDVGSGADFAVNADTTLYIQIRIENGYDTSGMVFKPMIRDARDTDPTYQPFAETNKELTDKAAGLWDNMIENGAVNYAPNSVTTQTKNTVEFTVNDDGTFIADGTASGDIFRTSVSANVASITITLPAGTYKYKLSDTTISGVTAIIKNASTATDIARSTNNSLEFTLTQETAIYVDWKIASGTQLTNQKMYALVTLASYTGPYVPYAMTNRELTEVNDYEVDTTSISGVTIMKRNNVVTVKVLSSFDIVHNQNYVVGQLPERFRPPINLAAPILTNEGTPKPTMVSINVTGQMEINGYMIATSGTYPFDGMMTYVTNK